MFESINLKYPMIRSFYPANHPRFRTLEVRNAAADSLKVDPMREMANCRGFLLKRCPIVEVCVYEALRST